MAGVASIGITDYLELPLVNHLVQQHVLEEEATAFGVAAAVL